MFTTFWLWSLDQFCCAKVLVESTRTLELQEFLVCHVSSVTIPNIVGRRSPKRSSMSHQPTGVKKIDHLRPLLSFFSIHQFLQTLGSEFFQKASSQGRSQTLGLRRPMSWITSSSTEIRPGQAQFHGAMGEDCPMPPGTSRALPHLMTKSSRTSFQVTV